MHRFHIKPFSSLACKPFSRWVAGRGGLWTLFFGAMALAGSGCANVELHDAFKGKNPPIKNNKIINEYCKSCHIHKDFDPGAHMAKVSTKYKRQYFRNASECRSCHYVEKDWIYNQLQRKTRRPEGVERGMYRKFEKQEMNLLKKREH